MPDTGYHFVEWSDGSSANPRTDTNVTANVSVMANFAVNTFTLGYTAGAGGTLTGNASQTVNYGGDGTAVTAVPDLGYHFVDWSDGSSANPRTDTNVTANVTVTANFAINTFTLTVTQPANGTIAPTTATYDYNTVVDLTATPATGYHFVEWTGACSGSGACSVTMDDNKSVSATFAINTYTLTVTQPAHGAITPVTATYDWGTVVNLTATADPGWQFVEWTGDCTGSGACSVTMDGDKTVTATFVPKSDVTCDVQDLIDVINAANSYGQPHTIHLATGCTYTLTEPYTTYKNIPVGLPLISGDITLIGDDTTITAPDSLVIFLGVPGGKLTLVNVSLVYY